ASHISHGAYNAYNHIRSIAVVGGRRRVECPGRAALHNPGGTAPDGWRCRIHYGDGLAHSIGITALVAGAPGANGAERLSAQCVRHAAENPDNYIGAITEVDGARAVKGPGRPALDHFCSGEIDGWGHRVDDPDCLAATHSVAARVDRFPGERSHEGVPATPVDIRCCTVNADGEIG